MFGGPFGPWLAAQTSPALGHSLHATRESRRGPGPQSAWGAPAAPKPASPSKTCWPVAGAHGSWAELQQGWAWAERAKFQGTTVGIGMAEPTRAPQCSPHTPHPSWGQGKTGVTAMACLSSGEHPSLLFTQDHQDLRVSFFQPFSFDDLRKTPAKEKKIPQNNNSNT